MYIAIEQDAGCQRGIEAERKLLKGYDRLNFLSIEGGKFDG